jgi:hypothetical protein
MWFIVFSVLKKYLVHICASILVEFVGAAKDDECNLTVAKNTQLVSLLHHAKFPLVECYLHIQMIAIMTAVFVKCQYAT